jgi:predicted cobalt transporter CbtA
VVSKSVVPAELSAQFAVSSLVSAALFWMVLGGVSGFFYQRIMLSSKQPHPAS